MAYNHGVYVSEVPTSILPPVSVSAGIPMIVGTAPINMTDPTNINKSKLCYTYDEIVKAFGYVPPAMDVKSGLKKFEYSICEFAYSQFALYGVAPVIVVNVLDPQLHKSTANTQFITLEAKTGSTVIAETGILLDSVSIAGESASYIKDTDYKLTFDDNGYLVVTSLKDSGGEYKCEIATQLTFSADKIDPSKVTADDIVGGISSDGFKKGLELISVVYPKHRLLPGILLAPGFSDNPTVAAVMSAKVASINQHFKAISLIDIPTDSVKDYSNAPEWKNSSNVMDSLQVACWPMVALGDIVFHMSTQLAGLIGKVDSQHNDVPFVTPSNHNFQMTASVLSDGTEVWLGVDMANLLNGNGIVTALNFEGGWKCWGSRTAIYPSSTDVKDAFIPIRRMFNWVGNTLVRTFWQKVDGPLTPRLVQTIVNSANMWLNGQKAMGYILGGRVEFLESENPTQDLMDGKIRLHVYITPPSPAREIDFILEYDPEYIKTLFG